MNKRTDNERLLEDVLAGESSEGVRLASLENILRLARQRRRVRAIRRVSALAVLLIASTVGVMLYLKPQTVKHEIATTRPLTPTLAWVSTRPLSATELVTSQPLKSDQIVFSLREFAIVQTVSESFREVNDDELLALAAPQVVALVRRGPHEADLVFVTPQASQDTN